MLTWLTVNMGTIVVFIILVIIVGAIVRKLYADRKRGIHSCGGGCPGCTGSCASCHSQQK